MILQYCRYWTAYYTIHNTTDQSALSGSNIYHVCTVVVGRCPTKHIYLPNRDLSCLWSQRRSTRATTYMERRSARPAAGHSLTYDSMIQYIQISFWMFHDTVVLQKKTNPKFQRQRKQNNNFIGGHKKSKNYKQEKLRVGSEQRKNIGALLVQQQKICVVVNACFVCEIKLTIRRREERVQYYSYLLIYDVAERESATNVSRTRELGRCLLVTSQYKPHTHASMLLLFGG